MARIDRLEAQEILGVGRICGELWRMPPLLQVEGGTPGGDHA